MRRGALSADQICQTAERIVDERGWSDLTIAALADELGVRGPSLYAHVVSLDEIRARVIEMTMAGISEALRDAALGRAAGDALREQCHAWRSFARRHPHRYQALTQSAIDPDVLIEASAGADAATRAALRGFDLSPEAEASAQFGLFAAVHGFVSLEISRAFITHLADDAMDRLFQETIDRVISALEGTNHPGQR